MGGGPVEDTTSFVERVGGGHRTGVGRENTTNEENKNH